MKLKNYLNIKNITSKRFAELINVSEISVSRYINGVRLPAKNVQKKIHTATNGLVTYDDFFYGDDKYEDLSEIDLNKINKLKNEIESGSRFSLAKAITLVESTNLYDQKIAEELISVLKANNKSLRIGITGVPGVGKSTFIEALGLLLIEKGLKIAVLAIDPSSHRTGGSILGDKTRMEKLSAKTESFIRPSPNKGHLGGVAKNTRESIICLEAAGFDVIFIETMGVGQAEIAVYNMVDIFLVLLLPSGGDDLQGIKKGIIELADMLIINKCDEELISSANTTMVDYQNAISIIKPPREDHKQIVMRCSSLHFLGIDDIWRRIEVFFKNRIKNKSFIKNRTNQNLSWMWELIEQKLADYVKVKIKSDPFTDQILDYIKGEKINIVKASKLILNSYLKKK